MSVTRLKEALQECSNSFETGDIAKSDEAVAGVIGLLESTLESPPPDAEDVLAEIYRFLLHPDDNQMAVDALSLELPGVVLKFASLSDKCEEIAGSIIKHLVDICSPRDMLAILCEALDTHINVSKAPNYYVLLLNELSKVFLHIQRRHVGQIKAALPVILKVINAVSLEVDEGYEDSLGDLFSAALSIGSSIKIICDKLEGREKQELCSILGLYVLHDIALVSRSRRRDIVSSCAPYILEFSYFIRYCGLSYCGLLTGCVFNSLTGEISEVDDDDFVNRFSFARDGASLAVIWGHSLHQVADAAGQQLDFTLTKIRADFNKRWLAVGTLKFVLSSADYPWQIKSQSLDLLLSIIDGINSKEVSDISIDFSSFVSSVFAVLKGIEKTMIYTPDASLRKKAYGALRKVLSNLPCNERVHILKALISNSDSPSMIAIFIDLVKEQIHMESSQKKLGRDETTEGQTISEISSFWSSHALDVVELVLKPPKGGPPPLPEHSEPVLSALNLYRFILILESSGKTNRTGVLSECTLRKAYSEWLLPLRTLTMAIQSENEKDENELTNSVLCAIDPVQLVLHRCIELVEEKLKRSS